jgi:uncharacterized protein (DUF1330 family)
MPAYVIAQMTVHDIDMYYEYASKIFETTKPYGGKILAANDAEVREGSLPFRRTIIGEFPDGDSLRAWYESDAYQAIIGLRRNSTEGALFFVEGLTMPPRRTSETSNLKPETS